MVGNKFWVAFISQTGSEVVALSKELRIKPDVIVVHKNSLLHLNKTIGDWFIAGDVVRRELPQSPTVEDYEHALKFINVGVTELLITLHGYMRIIPPTICEKYTIFNGHPALIDQYPELKGKDPQKRTYQNLDKYTEVGSVVHRCTAAVDAGEILTRGTRPTLMHWDEEDLFETLRATSRFAWVRFFGDVFNYMTKAPNITESTDINYITEIEKVYPETCKAFKQCQAEDYALFCKKQHDYGPHNISLGSALLTQEDIHAAQCGIVFRLHDKVQRLLNMVVKKGGKTPAANESVEDAFIDTSVYGIIARIVKRGAWCK